MDDILGIVGQLDISDIYGSLEKMASSINQIEGVSKQMSKRLQQVFTELGNVTEKELAGKSKEALNTISQALAEVKAAADRNVASIESTVSKLTNDISRTTTGMKDVPMSSERYKELERELNGYNNQLSIATQNLARAREEAALLSSATEQVNNALNFDDLKNSADQLIERLKQVNTSASTLARIQSIKDSGMSADLAELSSLLQQYKDECVETARVAGEAYKKQGEYVAQLREQTEAAKSKWLQSTPGTDDTEKLQNEYNALAVKLNIAEGEWSELNKTQKEAANQAVEAQEAISRLNKTVTSAGSTAEKTGEKIREEAEETGETVKEQTDSIEKALSKLKTIAAGYLSFEFAKQFGEKVLQVRGQFQQLEVAFTTMLGSAEEANALMDQLTKTAAITPFDLQGVAGGAKQLLAYGTAANEVNDILVHLGDIAAGLSLPLNDLVYLYGTTMTQGRMFTQDLRQFMGRGIPIAEELAKQFGVTKDKVGELVTAGKVGAEEFKKAIMAMSSEGGKFAGLMEAQSKTISGQISNIEDSIDVMYNNIGKSNEGIINSALGTVSELVENYERVGKVLMGLVATYGAYKAAVIAVNAVKAIESALAKKIVAEKVAETGATLTAAGAKAAEKAVTDALTVSESAHAAKILLVEKAQKLLNATMLANPYVLIATLLGTVIGATIMAKTEQERLTEALDEYNREKDDAIAKEEEHRREIEALIGVAQDESLSTQEREKAIKKVLLQYPSLLNQYKNEANLLSKIRDIKREIAELDGRTTRTRALNEKNYVDEQIKKIEKEINARSKGNKSDYNEEFSKTTGQQLRDRLKALREESKKLDVKITKDRQTDYLADLTGLSNGQLQAQINERNKLLAKMTVDNKKYGKVKYGGVTGEFTKEELETQIAAFKQEQARRKKVQEDSAKDFDKEHKNQLKDAQKKLKEWENLSKAENREKSNLTYGKDKRKVRELSDEEYKEELEARQKAVNEAKKIVDADEKAANGGITTKKDKSAEQEAKKQEELVKMKRKFEQEQIEQNKKAAFAEEEATIAGMKEGSEKTLRQMRLNQKKREEEIERQRQQMLQKNIDYAEKEYERTKKKGDKGFYESGLDKKVTLTKDQEREYNARLKEERAIQLEEQKKFEDDLIRSHQSYTDKRLEIERKYTEDVAALNEILAQRRKQLTEAKTEEERQSIQNQIDAIIRSIGQANKDRLQQTVDIDMSILREDPRFSQAWQDLKYVSTDTLTNLIGLFRKYKNEYATNPEAMEKWMERIRAMSDELARRNPYTALIDSRRKLNEIGAQKSAVEDEIKSLTFRQRSLSDLINFANAAGMDSSKMQEELAETQKKLADAQAKLSKLTGEEIDQQAQYKKALNDVSSAVGNLGSAFSELGNTIGGTQGEILNLIGEVFQFTNTTITAIQSLSETASGVIGAIEKVSVVLTIISAAISLMKQLSSLLPDSHGQYENYRDKVNEINTMKKAVRDYELAVLQARQAEQSWFASSGMNNLKNQWELSSKARDDYFKKLYEEQAIYEDETGSGWLTNFGAQASRTIGNIVGGVNKIIGLGGTVIDTATQELAKFGWANVAGGQIGANMYLEDRLWAKGLDRAYQEGMTAAINNLRIETRSASKGFLGSGIGGHSQRTEDLIEWTKKNLGMDLFEDGWLNDQAYEQIMEKYADKLVGETKATLEELKELKEKHDEFIKQLQEYVDNLYSPVIDNMVDAVWDWFDQGKDAMDSFRDYAGKTFRNIASDLIRSRIMEMFGNSFGNKLKALYESYFDRKEISYDELMKGIAKATGEAADAFREAQPVLQDTINTLEDALKASDISMRESVNNDQQATYNSLEKWSYDQADELISRATAMQIIQEHIYEGQQAIVESNIAVAQSMAGMKENLVYISENIAATMELQESSNSKLDRIISNTLPISEIRDIVKKIYNEK